MIVYNEAEQKAYEAGARYARDHPHGFPRAPASNGSEKSERLADAWMHGFRDHSKHPNFKRGGTRRSKNRRSKKASRRHRK